MDFTHALTFFGGFIADLLRQALLPQTQRWVEYLFPQLRRNRNTQQNLALLELREKLERLGHDPTIAAHAGDNVAAFTERLEKTHRTKREVCTDMEACRLASHAQTQTVMNILATDRFHAADRLLSSTIERFIAEMDLTENARKALEESQRLGIKYRLADAEFEGLVMAEGGSMEPLITASLMESITVDRIARLNDTRDWLNER